LGATFSSFIAVSGPSCSATCFWKAASASALMAARISWPKRSYSRAISPL
jgi:hypothetical protein